MAKLVKHRAARVGRSHAALCVLLVTSPGCYLSRRPAFEQAAPDVMEPDRSPSAAGAPGGGEPSSRPTSDPSRPPSTGPVEPRDAAADARTPNAPADAHIADAARPDASARDECAHIDDPGGADDGDAGPRPRASLNVAADARPEGAGTPEPALVAGAIKRELRALLRCYQLAPAQRAAVGGVVGVRFTVEHGAVTAVDVTRDTVCGGTADCVAQTLQALALSGGAGDGSVTYSYTFSFAVPH